MFARMNHLNMCVSYPATLRLLDEVSKLHTVPIQKWINDGALFKFWGDNVDKQQRVRDYRSEHCGVMLHMYSLLAGRSRTSEQELAHTGKLRELKEVPNKFFLPHKSDIQAVKGNLEVIVSRILVKYFPSLAFLSSVVPKHILHKYSKQMAEKSEVIVLDVLMKDETLSKDMLDIMRVTQEYLGKNYPQERRVHSGGDHLTYERQVGAQRHMIDGNTTEDRLELLEPVAEDWHFLLTVVIVS